MSFGRRYAIVTYVGSHVGENVAKELQTCQKTILPSPVLDPSIETKWRTKLAVHQAIVQAKVDSYKKLLITIETAMKANPSDMGLTEKLIEVTEKRSKAEQELLEDQTVESVMTLNKKYSHSNAHRTHREDNHKLSENQSKVYSLLMGQCTVPLKDKMKEDTDWHDIADKYNHIWLLLLIEKTVLKQTKSKNPYQRVLT